MWNPSFDENFQKMTYYIQDPVQLTTSYEKLIFTISKLCSNTFIT